MSRQLSGVVQNVEKLLALQPEELGFVILQILNSEPSAAFDRLGLFQELTQGLVDASRSGLVVAEAVGEAMSSLESGGYLASRPASDRKILLFVTRRGREASGGLDALAFRNSTLLPASLLHPAVAQRAQAAFLRGEYDTAVFTAFKAVEVAVRNAAALPDNLIGISLMRAAFHMSTGSLTAKSDTDAEREAVAHLFAGAIGHAKNPHSHRDEPVQPEDACHLLMFASYLLRIVDIRATDKVLEKRP